MAHIALYRTYRPQNFSEVVGQQHVVKTLKNQIKYNRLAHAYLFAGPRGTGKTSIARIVAKAANCHAQAEGNPCLECESCQALLKGNHPDIIELDGASNNGVDEIRDIRDRVKYSPSNSPFKVYIIDEVHMLSTGAFNALLKTLEEPPAHVIFMLATTEIHKVPDTILSRVQQFDLKQISTIEIEGQLTNILNEQNVPFEESVPSLIATLAAGGMRDALSILDQAIAYKEDELKLAHIHELNGSVDEAVLSQLVISVIEQDLAKLSEDLKALFLSGKLPSRIVEGLLKFLAKTLKVQRMGLDDPKEIVQLLNSKTTLRYLKALNELSHDLKLATDAELMLEIGLIGLSIEKVTDEGQVVSSDAKVMPADNQAISGLAEQVAQLAQEVEMLKAQLGKAEVPVAVDQDLPVDEVEIEEVPAAPAPIETVAPEKDLEKSPKSSDGLKIEDVLAVATREDKADLQQRIKGLNAFADGQKTEAIMALVDGEVVAASGAGCILVYQFESQVQKVLQAEIRDLMGQVLGELKGGGFEFLAMPEAFWQEARDSYLAAKKNNEAPNLKQYPQVAVAPTVEKKDSNEKKPAFYEEIVEKFGDLVEVHE